MFVSESSYQSERRGSGAVKALAYYADIGPHTRLFGIKEGIMPREVNDPRLTRKERLKQQEIAQPALQGERALFDLNEHFIELSNAGEHRRSLSFLASLLFVLPAVLVIAATLGDLFTQELLSEDWKIAALLGGGLSLFAMGVSYIFWRLLFSSIYFTSLRARYRFNRTTRKVYALRPKKYGGNAVLDWDRVQAHVNWRPPKSWTAEQLATSEAVRLERTCSDGSESNLVLYWPPLDANDSERKGEDVLWVGPSGSGEPLWQYIRTYMEDGMEAVPQPNERNWLRKGFSSPGQYLEETVMHGSRARDEIVGEGISSGTAATFGINVIWAPLHSLAERFCYWPTFPEEWNSDCGQKRRESGIGPEDPQRWQARA